MLHGFRSPTTDLVGQGARFIVVGGTTASIYLLSTSLLALDAGISFEVALGIGFCLAITVNFTLQRLFVWVHHEAFALPMHRQLGRYLSVAGTQYALTAASIAVLPRTLGLPTEAVYLATAMLLATISFVIYRNGVFHAGELQRRR